MRVTTGARTFMLNGVPRLARLFSNALFPTRATFQRMVVIRRHIVIPVERQRFLTLKDQMPRITLAMVSRL